MGVLFGSLYEWLHCRLFLKEQNATAIGKACSEDHLDQGLLGKSADSVGNSKPLQKSCIKNDIDECKFQVCIGFLVEGLL